VGIFFMPFLRSSGQQHSADVLRHIDHAIMICGEDHVGIGTDGYLSATDITPAYLSRYAAYIARRKKEGVAAPGEDEKVLPLVPEYNSFRRFELLYTDLRNRGYSDRICDKIIGGNFARVFEEVWG
jgi:membrane dipeptidase